MFFCYFYIKKNTVALFLAGSAGRPATEWATETEFPLRRFVLGRGEIHWRGCWVGGAFPDVVGAGLQNPGVSIWHFLLCIVFNNGGWGRTDSVCVWGGTGDVTKDCDVRWKISSSSSER